MTEEDHTYVIAEAGINHNGDFDIAVDLIEEAAKTGADGVKFQFWDAPEMASDKEMAEMLRSWEFEQDEWEELSAVADEAGIEFFASVFDTSSTEMLMEIGAPKIKVASCDVTNLPLLRDIAEQHKPVILSTGMATMSEVATAVETIRQEYDRISLLHCVSSYPVDIDDLNLKAMDTLKKAFDTPVGYSDHTEGIIAPVLAVGRGATIIEKHFTLDKEMEGPDHALSAEPDEFSEMVSLIQSVEAGLGDGRIKVMEPENDFKHNMRRGLAARMDIPEGAELTEENVKVTRPEAGISPIDFTKVLGRTTKRAIETDEPIKWSDI